MKKQSKHLIHLTDKNFSSIVTKGITLVDLGAAWCKPCLFLTPIVNKLADNYAGKINVAKFDVEIHKCIPRKLGIHSIPTIIIFLNGREVERFIGIKSYNTYRKSLDKYLNKKA